MENVKEIDSQVFKAYFQTNRDANTNDMLPPPVYGCMVVASTIEEAMDKIHAAFPDKVTTSLFGEGANGEIWKVVF